jgi:hypothetical protein
MRIRSWTAFFREATFIFWNESAVKGAMNGVASNIYLGPEERGYIKALQAFTAGFDPRATPLDATTDSPALVRAYALRSPSVYAAYLHAYTDHTNPTTSVSLSIDPFNTGTATWIDPSTGTTLGTATITTVGAQPLAVPAFTTDVALVIR